MRNKKTLLLRLAAIVLALLVWQIASMAVGTDLLLVSPLKVAKRLAELVFEKDFFPTVFYSLVRVFSGFLIAFFLGIILAVAAGRCRLLEHFLWPYVTAFKSVPVASFIILALIFLSYDRLTVFITFLIAFPVIYSNVLQGYRSTDPGLLEMANLYRVPFIRQLFGIYLPGLRPYVLSASSTAVGMGFKAGVAAEVIGIVTGSIGEKLYRSKIYLETADLFAWTIVIIVLSAILERLFRLVLDLIYRRLEAV